MTNETKTPALKRSDPGSAKTLDEDSAPMRTSSLPDGVIAVNTVQYKVGEYTYSNRDDALAEHSRQSAKRSKTE